MNRAGHEDADFFVGTEVEHSPAHGLKTLFVVGVQDTDTISKKCRANWCEHIYFGANQSFPRLETDDGPGWSPWEFMILTCLEESRKTNPNPCNTPLDDGNGTVSLFRCDVRQSLYLRSIQCYPS